MRTLPLTITAILSGVFLTVSTPAFADMYRYVDEKGVVHYTNVPTSQKFEWRMREAEQQGKASGRKGEYDALLQAAAEKYGVEPALAKAVARAESNFNSHAVSRKDAKGIMQLLPETASRLGVRDIYDPQENIEGGVRHLSRLLKLFPNNMKLAVAAYNAGENAVIKYGYNIPPYPETRNYVKKVMAFYGQYKSRNA